MIALLGLLTPLFGSLGGFVCRTQAKAVLNGFKQSKKLCHNVLEMNCGTYMAMYNALGSLLSLAGTQIKLLLEWGLESILVLCCTQSLRYSRSSWVLKSYG